MMTSVRNLTGTHALDKITVNRDENKTRSVENYPYIRRSDDIRSIPGEHPKWRLSIKFSTNYVIEFRITMGIKHITHMGF